jgi:hypothetical protein
MGEQAAAGGHCPECGQAVAAGAVYCPNCGRPYAPETPPVDAQANVQDATYATAPVQAGYQVGYTDAPPPLPDWANQPTTSGGIAGLATGPALAPEQPIRSHKRRNLFTAISAVVVVALLGSGVYWAYAAFAARSDVQLAHYYPSNTVAFVSADLAAAANNNYKLNPADLLGGDAKMIQQGTGLDLQKDVLPWAGPDIALGVFPLANSKQGTAITNPAAAVGVVGLVQSHDDNAAKNAVAKFNAHLKQQGSTLKQATYKGFSLYSSGSDNAAGLFGNGSGWVIIASNTEAAHAVIDRLNGNGETLSDQQPFKDATSNLPSGHFGTYYLNLQQTLSSFLPTTAPNGLTSISVPFIESYPVAGGYLGWTNTGERSQITFHAVRNPNIPNVTGDTTGFASLVPGDAVAYAGAGNLGKLVQAFINQFGSLATGSDPLKTALGISMTDPLAQQPVGLAVIKSGSREQPVFYVHVSDDAAATQLLNKLASVHNWTTQTTTIAGRPATTLFSAATPTDGLPGAPDGTPSPVTTQANIVAVAFTVNNTLVIASDTNSATLVAQVAQGNGANLASNSTFHKIVTQAPSGAAATAYVNASALRAMGGADAAAVGSPVAGFFSHFDALALTLVWNDSVLQATFDAGLHA